MGQLQQIVFLSDATAAEVDQLSCQCQLDDSRSGKIQSPATNPSSAYSCWCPYLIVIIFCVYNDCVDG